MYLQQHQQERIEAAEETKSAMAYSIKSTIMDGDTFTRVYSEDHSKIPVSADNLISLMVWYDLESKAQNLLLGNNYFFAELVNLVSDAVADEEFEGMKDEEFEKGR